MNHPIIAAKQIASMAQIGKGRVGVNIVAGWNKPEYDALGIHLFKDHPTRYRYTQEWFDLIKRHGQVKSHLIGMVNSFKQKDHMESQI